MSMTFTIPIEDVEIEVVSYTAGTHATRTDPGDSPEVVWKVVGFSPEVCEFLFHEINQSTDLVTHIEESLIDQIEGEYEETEDDDE